VELASKRHGEARQAWRGSAGLGSARSGAAAQASLAQGNRSHRGRFFFVQVCYHLDMADNATIVEQLLIIIEELRAREDADGGDVFDDIVTVSEAASIANITAETMRKWAQDFALGRLYAGSLWLVSRRRLLRHIEKRYGLPAMFQAASRDKKHQRSVSVQGCFPVSARFGR